MPVNHYDVPKELWYDINLCVLSFIVCKYLLHFSYYFQKVSCGSFV